MAVVVDVNEMSGGGWGFYIPIGSSDFTRLHHAQFNNTPHLSIGCNNEEKER